MPVVSQTFPPGQFQAVTTFLETVETWKRAPNLPTQPVLNLSQTNLIIIETGWEGQGLEATSIIVD